MLNINSQGILKGAVKTDLKVVNISNFNLSGTVSTYCIQILILETHQRFRKIQTASKFTCSSLQGPRCQSAAGQMVDSQPRVKIPVSSPHSLLYGSLSLSGRQVFSDRKRTVINERNGF